MKFLDTYSSIVIAGEGFSPYIFQSSSFSDLLGEPDPRKQIILPMISTQVFPSSGFKVVIIPDRIDLGYSKKDFLPEELKKLADSIVKKLQQLDGHKCTGIGINLDVVISDEILGMTGIEYCRKNYLNINNIENKLSSTKFLANTIKLLYMIDNIKYTVNIEPNFRSNGKNLVMKVNAHQSLKDSKQLIDALKKFFKIKKYLSDFHDTFLGKS